MKVIVLLGVQLCCLLGTEAFIIPDELPSILSVIYSNIPTIKKGTDSRLGWGFRLGDRADFQVMVELGPQTNTQPLANQGEGGNNKRNALENLANILYAQREHAKKVSKAESVHKNSDSNNDGAEWLKSWSQSLGKPDENESFVVKPKPGIAVGEIDAKSVIPDDSVILAREKLKNKSKNVNKVVTTTSKTQTTSKEDTLDNVDID